MSRNISENAMEIFKDVPGYEGLYMVSNIGRIFSYHRKRMLIPKRSKVGYLRVTLCDGHGNHWSQGMHRLVAMAFIPNPANKPTVNHINEIKDDNRVENLEWATIAEQNTHGTRIKRATAHTDWRARTAKIDYHDIASKHDYGRPDMCGRRLTEVSKDGVVIGIFESQKEASNYSGVSQSKVSRCISGMLKSSKGFTFRKL